MSRKDETLMTETQSLTIKVDAQSRVEEKKAAQSRELLFSPKVADMSRATKSFNNQLVEHLNTLKKIVDNDKAQSHLVRIG